MQKENKSEKTGRNKFTRIQQPKGIELNENSLIKTGYPNDSGTLPLVISPLLPQLDLAEWVKNNRQFIEHEMRKHGAVLFRGFRVNSPLEFEQFASALCTDLFNENGEHPREAVSENIYTPVFYPHDKKLLWHNENSFNDSWPMKIWFFCAQPAEQGGETTIVDSRKIFQLVDKEIRDKFAKKNIMYVRNYSEGVGLSWQTVFRTTQKAVVEEYCQKHAIAFEWKDGEHLKTYQIRPAVAKHPVTGEFVWWNQVLHWHTSCLEPDVYASLLQLFSEEDLPRNCFYGDGTKIDASEISAIYEAYQSIEICFPWKKGDILMLDNMLVAHARNPYHGQRNIYVSMGDMMSQRDLPQ